MSTSAAVKPERRRVRRYPAVELRANLRTKKGLFGESWTEVHATDFSHAGVSIDVDDPLKVGQSISMSFSLKMEMGDITLDKVSGVVRHAKSIGGQTRCGIEFTSASEHAAQLTRIESLLARSQSVAERIQKQN